MIALIAIWILVTVMKWIAPLFLPAPSAIVQSYIELWPLLPSATVTSITMSGALVFLLAGLILLSGCGSGTTATDSDTNQNAEPKEMTEVKMAVLPYFDYTLFVAAKELGLDQEQGLSLELVPFPHKNQAIQALLNGSIDVAQGAMGSLIPLVPNAPNTRVVLNNDQFKGFVYTGREGQIETFEQMMEKNGGDFEKAQKDTLQQFKGKKILMVESSFGSMMKSALEQVDLSYDDVNIMNFQNDAQAATAFLRGEGDLYIGGLPQEMRLLNESGFVAVAGNEVLGRAGLWFSNTAVTEEYLENNRDTVHKLAAIHYRMTRYLEEKPEEVLKPMTDYLKKHASSDLSMEEAVMMKNGFVDFSTIEQSKEGVYNNDSPIYWEKAAKQYVQENEELENIPEGSVNVNTHTFIA